MARVVLKTLTLVSAFIRISSSISSTICPTQCQCRNSKVKCHRLLKIPRIFPENTTKIAIDQAFLEEIPNSVFSGLSALVEIKFTECKISVISQEAFPEIPSLRTIQFERCDITDIRSKAFFNTGWRLRIRFRNSKITRLHSLAFYNLQGSNSIHWRKTRILNLISNAFFNITKMEKMSFIGCAMTIDQLAFNEIYDLRELIIKNTYFNTIACNGITEILSAGNVVVSGNKMNCDCGIQWMRNTGGYEWFLNTTICSKPESYFNSTMAEVLSVDRFWCSTENRNSKTNCGQIRKSSSLLNSASTDTLLSNSIVLLHTCLFFNMII